MYNQSITRRQQAHRCMFLGNRVNGDVANTNSGTALPSTAVLTALGSVTPPCVLLSLNGYTHIEVALICSITIPYISFVNGWILQMWRALQSLVY